MQSWLRAALLRSQPSGTQTQGPISSSGLLAVLIVAFVMFIEHAAAAYPRSFASGGLTPTIGSDDDEAALPPYNVKPFSQAYFSWEAVNTTDGWYMNGTFNFSNGEYVAIGLNSYKKMDGPIVICNANSSANSATCYDYMGDTYSIRRLFDDDLAPALQATTTMAASANGVTLISFTKIIVSYSMNVSLVNIGEFNRMIFARGKWNTLPGPNQHQTADRSSFSVNFVTGMVIAPTSNTYRYVLYPAIGLMVLVSIVLKIAIGCYRVKISDRLRYYGVIGLCGAYVLVVAAYILVYYSDYIIMVAPKASFRATGQGNVFIMGTLLLPVARRFFFSEFFGISPERAIKFHIFLALLFLLTSTVHGAGMWYQYGTSQIIRWRDKDTASRLPGLIAYILVLVQVSVGLLRHLIGYERFRAMHYLYAPILFCMCCHAPIMCYAVIPAIALYLLTNIQKRFFVPVGAKETITYCEVDAATQTTIIDVVKYDPVPPGSWYFITLPDIGHVAHPFSVYRCRKSAEFQTLRFIVRNTAARSAPPIPSGILPKAIHGMLHKGKKETEKAPGWTTKLYEYIASGKKLTEYRLDGPYGILEHNPMNYYNYILVAGGVGISSIGYMLSKIAEADAKIIGNKEAKCNMLLVWVVSDPSWVHLLGEEIAVARHLLKRTCPNLKCVFKIFITNSRTLDPKFVRSLSPSITSTVSVVYGSRPNFMEEFKAFETQTKNHYITSADNVINTLGSAVMYCCGPEGLIASAVDATKSLKELSVDVNLGAYEF
jgi:predicted ferric reductase